MKSSSGERDDYEMMTMRELAELLHVPINTLYHWRTKGLGPKGIQIGRNLLFRRIDVEVWIDQQPRI